MMRGPMRNRTTGLPSPGRGVALGLVAVGLTAAACSSIGRGSASAESGATASVSASAAARADSVRHAYTEEDVAFMQGMIHHHAQALVMSRLAPTHGASETIRTLTARIINAQMDEIRLMQRWLENRGERVPDPAAIDPHDPGGEPMMRMPGMLTDAQMDVLDEARGEEFDRLFLVYMIQHHQGAVDMVDELFGKGAGKAESVYKLASDIAADQTTEIERMQTMLRERVFGN